LRPGSVTANSRLLRGTFASKSKHQAAGEYPTDDLENNEEEEEDQA
jgi:hypothetical protein